MLTPKDVQSILSYLQSINGNININSSQLNDSLKKHSDYPSLLSIVDVISDLGFKSSGYELNPGNVESLSFLFLAQIRNIEYNINEIVLVEKRGNLLFFDQKQLSVEEFLQLSTGVFILAEMKSITVGQYIVLGGVILLSGLLLFLYNLTFFSYFILLILSLTGLFMTFYFFESLFNIRINILNKICYKREVSDCKSISSSKKWKIFSYVNFSDLGLVFFFTQILIFISLFLNVSLSVLIEVYLACGIVIIPTLVLSIIYQLFVEKKWCKICLLISLNLSVQLAVAFYLYGLLGYPNFKYYPFVAFSMVYIIVFSLWSLLFKKTLEKNQRLTELNNYLNDVVDNYDTFKAVLLLNKPKDTNMYNNQYLFSFGSTDNVLNITVVTDPFCKYCKSTNRMIRAVLDNYSQNLNINFLFNVDLTDENINYYRQITDSYINNNKESFLDFICSKNNADATGLVDFSDLIKIDKYLVSQSELCNKYEITYFPTILIEGYEYPLKYDFKMLEKFIPNLISDKNSL